MVCKNILCTKFHGIPESREEEEDGQNRQMQSVLLFEQTQQEV